MANLPILYTFRRCPYAMRARMGLAYAGVDCLIREVDLKHKPTELLDISPKATVPVLSLEDGGVIEESLDILLWSLAQNDPDGWKVYPEETLSLMSILVRENDDEFKVHLDHYKYSDRFPEESQHCYRTRAEVFLENLEFRLSKSTFLFGERVCYADMAIFSFIRQFSNVEPAWFQSAPYPQLRRWLGCILEGELFQFIMNKYQPWQSTDPEIRFLSP